MIKVYKFSAEWCNPCAEMARQLTENPVKIDGVKMESVDVDDEPRLADLFNIQALPAIVITKDDVEISRHTGFMTPDQLRTFIQTSINEQ